MNTYHKVIICIFRFIGVLLLGYGAMTLVLGAFMMRNMAGMALFASLPLLGLGLVSYFAAIPLAKIITIGIDD